MKIPTLLIFFFVYSFVFGQSAVKIEFPFWRSYTNSNYVKDLVLDNHILWAAGGGVVKYDLEKGTRIKYVKEHGLAGNNVLKMVLHGHSLWIATASGITLYHTEKNTWKSFYKSDGLPDDAVTAVTVDTANNTIWFGTWEGYLFSFNTVREKWNFLPAKISIPDTIITSLALNPVNNSILVGTWGKGLYSYQPRTQVLIKQTFPSQPAFDDHALDFISALFVENESKQLWLGTVNNGLWILDLNIDLQAGLATGAALPRKVPDLPDDWLTGIDASPGRDQIFVTARGSGLHIYSRRTGQWETVSMTTTPTLTTNRLNACAAGENHIFLGSEGEGVIRVNIKNGTIKNKKLTYFKSSNEVANNKVSVITPDNRNHRLWIGTEGNGAAHFDQLAGTWTILNTGNHILDSDVVNCITVDKDDDAAWIGTDQGMVRCEARGGKHCRYGLAEGLSSIMIYASGYDPADTLWAAFYYGRPAIFNPNLEKWRPLENIPGCVCYELSMANNNPLPSMWLATTDGVMNYDVKNHKITNYWPDFEFRSLLFDAKRKAIWAGSWEKGLFYMEIESGRQSQVKEFENLSVLDIKKDLQQDTIWFATSEGVFSLQPGEINEHKGHDKYTFTHYDAADGLGMNYVLAIGITADSIWFGTWGGGISKLLK